jgi:hypothetical protein
LYKCRRREEGSDKGLGKKRDNIRISPPPQNGDKQTSVFWDFHAPLQSKMYSNNTFIFI